MSKKPWIGSNNHEKMSIQAALGSHQWADEVDGSHHARIRARGAGSFRRACRKKVKTLRSHRTGKK